MAKLISTRLVFCIFLAYIPFSFESVTEVVGDVSSITEVPGVGELTHAKSGESDVLALKKNIMSIPKNAPKTEKYSREARNSKFSWISNVLSDKLSNFVPKSKNNQMCNLQSSLYEQSLQNLTLWAVQMREASASSTEGMLVGRTNLLGHYDECIGIQSRSVVGRYCVADIKFAPTWNMYPDFYSLEPIQYLNSLSQDSYAWDAVKRIRNRARLTRNEVFWGLCVPSACSHGDVEDSLRSIFSSTELEYNIALNISVPERYCYSRTEEKPLPFITKLIVFLLAFLSILSVVVTVYHFIRINSTPRRKGGFGWHLLKTFSMAYSFSSLTKKGGEVNLNVLDGMKFLSMCIIIFGHRILFSFGNMLSNPNYIEAEYERKNILLVNTNIVDSFFTISGFLVFFIMYPQFKRHGGRVIPFTIFYRWLRIVPAYMMLIAFIIFVLPYMEEGPFWKSIVLREAERCQHSWWTNFFFINNYVETHQMCTVHGWYLACDLQFFVLGVFLVYAFVRNHAFGLKLTIGFLAASIAIPFAVVYLNNVDGIMKLYMSLLKDPVRNEHYRDFYTKSYNRAAPYLVGILSGYLLHVLQEKKWKMTISNRWVTVLAISALAEGSQFYGFFFYDSKREYSPIENAIFAALHRPFWALMISAIAVIQLAWGFGAKFEYILTHSIYVPLSRLTYCAFLVHPVIQLLSTASLRNPTYMSFTKLAWMAMGDIACAYVVALWLYFIVEGPAGSLTLMFKNHVLGKKKQSRGSGEIMVKTENEDRSETTINNNLKNQEIPEIIVKDNRNGKMMSRQNSFCNGHPIKDQNQDIGETDLSSKKSGFVNYGMLTPDDDTIMTGNGNITSRSSVDNPNELNEKLAAILAKS